MANNKFDWSGVVRGVSTGLSGLAEHYLGEGVGDAVGSFIDGIGEGFGLMTQADYERDQQIQAEERAQQRTIDAEKRANDEYDRRMADERAYNDPTAQAERMRKAGLNPMASLGTTVQGSTTRMSAPTQSSTATPTGSRSAGSIGSAMQAMSAGEQLKQQKLQTSIMQSEAEARKDTLEASKNSEFQKGYSQWISNCMSMFEAGNEGGNGFYETSYNNYTYRPNYSISLDTNGALSVIGEAEGDEPVRFITEIVDDVSLGDVSVDSSDRGLDSVPGGFGSSGATITFDNSKEYHFSAKIHVFKDPNKYYPDFTIYDNSFYVGRLSEELSGSIIKNHKEAQDISKCLVDATLTAYKVLAEGQQADANALTAIARYMESNFKFGDTWNTKYILELVFKAISSATDIADAIVKVKGLLFNMNKPARGFVEGKHTTTYDGKGNVTRSTSTTTTHNNH